MWAGDWRRAYDYGDPRREALAVHEAAGLIDVSTLGKLIVGGPDAGAFLDRLYPNRFDNLKPGRIRYGVISSDAGPDPRRRDDLPPRRGLLLRHHHLERRRRRREWFSWWQAEWRMRGHAHRRHPGALGRQPGRAERARDPRPAHRPRLLERGLHLPRRQAGAGRRGSVPDAADRVRRRGRIRAPLPRRARRAPLGRASSRPASRTGSGPSASSRSGCCGCRRCTSWSARTPTPSPTPLEAAMPWIVKLDKEEDFIGRGRSSTCSERGAENTLVGLHDRRRRGADRGRRGASPTASRSGR